MEIKGSHHMFLEEEVYGMLNWGFGFVIGLQLLLFIGLWFRYRFDRKSFLYLITYLILLSFAGYNLLKSINTFELQTGNGSEEASFHIATAGILWIISVLFLCVSIFRLVKSNKDS